mgnify:CR=1 FL=1
MGFMCADVGLYLPGLCDSYVNDVFTILIVVPINGNVVIRVLQAFEKLLFEDSLGVWINASIVAHVFFIALQTFDVINHRLC